MDTLAVQLYTSLLPRRIRDFHPLERAHGAQTIKRGWLIIPSPTLTVAIYIALVHLDSTASKHPVLLDIVATRSLACTEANVEDMHIH